MTRHTRTTAALLAGLIIGTTATLSITSATAGDPTDAPKGGLDRLTPDCLIAWNAAVHSMEHPEQADVRQLAEQYAAKCQTLDLPGQ